jgi:hypothetical protein
MKKKHVIIMENEDIQNDTIKYQKMPIVPQKMTIMYGDVKIDMMINDYIVPKKYQKHQK